jgi:hypothetical protein
MLQVDLGYLGVPLGIATKSQACYLVDEANMITREVRPEEFSVRNMGEPGKAFFREYEGKGRWYKL